MTQSFLSLRLGQMSICTLDKFWHDEAVFIPDCQQ